MDAVVFDCDGVLVDSETIAGEVELEAFQRLGLFVDEMAFKAQVQGLSVEGWSRVLNALHVEQRGVPLPEGFAGEMSREITRRILADVRPIPGAVDAVHVVRGPKAIASSSPKVELYGKISALGLWNTFGHLQQPHSVTLTSTFDPMRSARRNGRLLFRVLEACGPGAWAHRGAYAGAALAFRNTSLRML